MIALIIFEKTLLEDGGWRMDKDLLIHVHPHLVLGVHVSEHSHGFPIHGRYQPRALVVATHGQKIAIRGPRQRSCTEGIGIWL